MNRGIEPQIEPRFEHQVAPALVYSKSKKSFAILKILQCILIVALLVCFVVRDRQLSSQIEALSEQVTDLQLQNDTLSQECERLSSPITSIRNDLVSLKYSFDSLKEDVVPMYHIINKHEGTAPCWLCFEFKYSSE